MPGDDFRTQLCRSNHLNRKQKSSHERQTKRKDYTLGLIVKIQMPSVRIHDGATEPQTHTHALGLGRFEQGKHFVLPCGINTGTIVMNTQQDLIALHNAANVDGRRLYVSTFERLHGVIEQIQHHLLQLRHISNNCGLFWQ